MWSTIEWWWGRSATGELLVNEVGVGASKGQVSWEALWQIQLEAWLLSDSYLELYVALKERGQGVQAGASAAFKVVLPHAWVSASVPVKQNAAVGYLNLEAFVEVWPLLCFYAQARDIPIDAMVARGGLEGHLPPWDVSDPDEGAVFGAGAGWLVRKEIDAWLARYDANDWKSLQVTGLYMDHGLTQEGFDYLCGRLMSRPNLTTLDLSRCEDLSHVNGLAYLPNLTHLKLNRCRAMVNVSGLARLRNLVYLDLSGCDSLPEGHRRLWRDDDLQSFLKSLR